MHLVESKFHFLKVETIVVDLIVDSQGLIPRVFDPIRESKLILVNIPINHLSSEIRLPLGPAWQIHSSLGVARPNDGRYHTVVAKPTLLDHGASFLKHVVPQLMRPIRSLWHEVIGFLFLSLAFLGGVSGFRVVRDFDGDTEDMFRLIVTGIFVLVMGGFGVSSFRRARKISRS